MTGLRLTASVLVLLAGTPAMAQKIAPTRTYGEDQANQTYETPKYRPAPSTPLDKNYGLPTFGMPGWELPQQRTQAPKVTPPEPTDVFSNTPPSYMLTTPQPGPWEAPDFFRRTGPDFNVPLTQPAAPGNAQNNAAGTTRNAPTTYGSGTSTNYSTGTAFSTGSSTYSGEPSSYSTDPLKSETPLFSTSQGMTTGDDTTTSNGMR
jgi:hypothetical protein